ncbi:MAG TPA: hypothetical protein GXX40_01485 [Firmicutes bacterium]|nr:hypothetical protein [Bacillota bacterium]
MNRICELLGIRYPIIQGGMAHVATGALAAAVSEAGGLGILGTGHASKEWIKAEIATIRSITQKPFGVNIAMFSPNVRDVVDVVVEEGVPVVTTGGGNPMPYIKALKEAGAKFIPVVPNA